MVGNSKLPIDKVVLMLVKDVDERCMLTKNQYVDKKLLSRRFLDCPNVGKACWRKGLKFNDSGNQHSEHS